MSIRRFLGCAQQVLEPPPQNPFALSDYNMLAFSFFHCNNMKGGVHIFNNQSEGRGGNSAVYMALICHSNNGDMSIFSTSASGQMCCPIQDWSLRQAADCASKYVNVFLGTETGTNLYKLVTVTIETSTIISYFLCLYSFYYCSYLLYDRTVISDLLAAV